MRSATRTARLLPLLWASLWLALVAGCVTAPTFHPPTPYGPDDSVRVGLGAWDNAGAGSPLGGASLFASYRYRDLIDVGGSLQLSTETRAFLGAGLTSGLRLRLRDEVLLGFELGAEYLDAFSYASGGRAPQVLLTLGMPAAFQVFEGAWVWVRPGFGAGATLYVFGVRGGPQPSFGLAYPSLRLSYGASYEVFDGLILLGESSTSVPFGGAYLGFAAVFSL